MWALKEEMEQVRSNPRQYFIEHLSTFDQLDLMPDEKLLPLLFCSTGSTEETRAYFELVERLLVARNFLANAPLLAQTYYYATIALNARHAGDFDVAQNYFLKSYDAAHRAGDGELTARALIGISSCFYLRGQLEETKGILQQALRLSSNIEDRRVLGDIFGNYALVLQYAQETAPAFEAYTTALRHYQKFEGYKTHINYWALIGNLAMAHIDAGQLDEADEYIQQFDDLINDDGMLLSLQGAMVAFSEFYSKKGNYQRAHQLLKRQMQAQVNYQKSRDKQLSVGGAQLIEQITAMEALKEANRQLVTENTMLQEQMAQGLDSSDEALSILKAVGKGIRESEFVPYFQAIWDTDKRVITGYEVLVRWHSNDEIIGPNAFIEIIEDTPLMIHLSEMIIRKGLEAFKMHCSRNDIRDGLTIGFNIAPYQLVNQDLVRFLESTCAVFGVPRKLVTLEITERTFIEHNQIAIAQLHSLKESGFFLALDDFGTGYSSLGCISELPLDIVKIDMGLVRGICNNEKSFRLFEGIVYMLKAIGLKSVAEGVETEEQYERLKQVGCNRAQGYLLNKPSAHFHDIK